jgi:hypothetical protein
MRIDNSKPFDDEVRFETIEPGEVFRYCDDLYIATDHMNDEGARAGVDLANGGLQFFDAGEGVRRVDARVIVLGCEDTP